MICYSVSDYGSVKLSEVEVTKTTPSSVFMATGRRARHSEYESYFDTKQEAVEYLMKKLTAGVERYKFNLERAERELAAAKREFA